MWCLSQSDHPCQSLLLLISEPLDLLHGLNPHCLEPTGTQPEPDVSGMNGAQPIPGSPVGPVTAIWFVLWLLSDSIFYEWCLPRAAGPLVTACLPDILVHSWREAPHTEQVQMVPAPTTRSNAVPSQTNAAFDLVEVELPGYLISLWTHTWPPPLSARLCNCLPARALGPQGFLGKDSPALSVLTGHFHRKSMPSSGCWRPLESHSFRTVQSLWKAKQQMRCRMGDFPDFPDVESPQTLASEAHAAG